MSFTHIDITRTTTPRLRPTADLGFGRYFSDHMFVADWSTESGWHNPRITPYAPFSIDPAAGVLHYGQAIFEGLKAFRQADGGAAFFRPRRHAQRMIAGAGRVCIPAVPEEDFLAAARALARVEDDWIPSAPNSALYLRPTLIATEAFLGVRPAQRYMFFIIGSPVGSYYAQGQKPVKIYVERTQVRASKGGLGGVKAGANYVASLQAADQAKRAGFDQVLWLDGRDHAFIEEVGTMNLFARLGDTLVTPPLSDSILSGVTRDAVIALAKHANIRVEERPLALQEILDAHTSGHLRELFGTGTAAVISPIGTLCVDDKNLTINNGETGDTSRWLYEHITGVQRGTTPDTFAWMERI